MPSALAILGGTPVRTRPFPAWPVFDARERAQLEDVLSSSSWGGYPSPNRKAAELASAFAAYQSAHFAIPTTSGTSALEVALKALGIGAGDEVIVPAITFAATPYAAIACMARPVFADVSASNACIDPESVKRLITRRTKAIIPVHYGASLADLDALTEISRAQSIPLVEDCAHVPGARFRDRGVGTHGALGCFSFQSSKPMTAGEGGMITTNDPELEQRCQSLINCGRRRPDDDFEGPLMGANYRMTEWQCGILLAQLARLPEQIEHKSRAAACLREGLAGIKGLTPVARDPRITRETIYAFVFLVDESALGMSRNRFVRALRAEGIPAGVANDPVYRSALFPRESAAYRKACELAGANPDTAAIDCPVAERLFEHAIVSIPHECLLDDDRDVDDIVAAAAKVVSGATETRRLETEMSPLYAGAARVKLDPPAGLTMLGYGNRVGQNSGVHDDLAAQALVLSDGANKVAIVGVDLLALGARIADDIRERAAAGTGIPADSILVCATHTHSAPAFNIFATPRADAKPTEGRDLEWERALPAKIATAIVQANENLEPAALRAATAQFTLGINRRLVRPHRQIQTAANRFGPADSEVVAFGAYRPNGTPIAFLINYPCHGVVLCEDNLLYSRDWPGFAMDEIESLSAGSRPVSIFIQGATGNIDPRGRGNFEVAQDHGRAMGRAAFDALAQAPSIADARIAARRIPINLKLKDISAELALARNCAAQTKASLDNHRGGDGYQLKRLRDHHAQSLAALAALEAIEDQSRRDRRVDMDRRELATAMTVAAIGNLAIVGIPGELFVELGLAIKAIPNFARILIAGYCNDLIGYIPTLAAYAEGGYEVDTARIAPGSGETIVETARSALSLMLS